MRTGRRRVYYGVLAIPEGKVNDYQITHKHHPAGTSFNLASMRTAMLAGHKAKKVKYLIDTTWHELSYEGGVWMTDYPIEQVQADAALARIRSGRVLVGGLGLGYAATILALRPAVRKVIVVEKERAVIDLTWAATCDTVTRLGGDRQKLSLAHVDLFDYLRIGHGKPVDWAFYDIWQSDGEGTFHKVVVPLLQLSNGLVRHRPIAWNEDVMRGQLAMALRSRSMFACMTPPLPHAPTLAWLCEEEEGNIWRNWSVPFFRWVRDTQPTVERRDHLAGYYAGVYGEAEWEVKWQAALRSARIMGPKEVTL